MQNKFHQNYTNQNIEQNNSHQNYTNQNNIEQNNSHQNDIHLNSNKKKSALTLKALQPNTKLLTAGCRIIQCLSAERRSAKIMALSKIV
jgi:hypothetical protein